MKYIKTEKEGVNFFEAIKDFKKGKIIRSYISEYAYYQDKYDDIYATRIDFCDEDIIESNFSMIKLDEGVWTSGEVQGKWNVIGNYKDILEV